MRTITGAVAWLVLSTTLAVAQEPAYSFGTGPTVLIDAAHHNLIDIVESHGRWLEEEGFRVRILRQPFDHELLVGADVIITAIPSAPRNAVTRPWTEEKFARAWQPPFPSAFTADEISVLREWVTEGGGLALVFDHMPVSNAVEELAAAFGVEVANGHAYDERMLRWEGDSLSRKEAGSAVFRRLRWHAGHTSDNGWPQCRGAHRLGGAGWGSGFSPNTRRPATSHSWCVVRFVAAGSPVPLPGGHAAAANRRVVAGRRSASGTGASGGLQRCGDSRDA
jgi:hypothetical protein